jgi:dual oxidase
MIGSGIGITPFSAILNDLEVNNQAHGDPYKVLHPRSARRLLRRTLSSRSSTSRTATLTDGAAARPEESSLEKGKTEARAPAERRCDFHWVVKDKNYLLWFSDLLSTLFTRSIDLAYADV